MKHHLDRILDHVHTPEKPLHHHHHHQQTPVIQVPPVVAQHPPQGVPTLPDSHNVFAHFIIGNAYYMTSDQWESDIVEAQKAHIDGFALSVAPQDHHTDGALQKAYDAAEKIGNFSLFISFDYLSGGPWPIDQVIAIVNSYKNRKAQFYYKGKPLVSTFEGVDKMGDWPDIKAATGCLFIPCWTSKGPTGIRGVLNDIDGASSWDAWPVGAEDMKVANDLEWMKALSGKPYMMPVAPWFYTNLPRWRKNWLWRGDDLWHYRWKQVIELQPPLVQILSWNDYGETHYIGPIYEAGVPEGASRYITNHPHDAWRTFLPHYIDGYRRNIANHHSNPASTSLHQKYPISYADKFVYWYRLNPGQSGSADGTTGNNPSIGQPEMKPHELSQDKVFVSAFVTEPSEVHVQIGSGPHSALDAAPGVNHGSFSFKGQTGPVRISILRRNREIVTTTGPAITEECAGGSVDWNASAALLLPEPSPATIATPVARTDPVTPEDYTKPYCEFMTANPTIFHAVDGFTRQLESQGYKRLPERDTWISKLEKGGKYYVTRNGSAFISFSIGRDYKSGNGMAIVAGHIDALTAKLKPVSKLPNKAGFRQLGVAPYAGALSDTWWDRDLSIGGRVLVQDSNTGRVESKLVKLDWPIARIPTLAPHFGAPSQGPFNKETQMVPIIGVDNSDLFQQQVLSKTDQDSGIKPGTFAATQPEKLVKVISKELGIRDYNSIISWELELYDSQPAQVGGLDKDLIFAGRIDDKLCCYAAQEALLASPDSTSTSSIKMVGMFDDEEIGSLLRQGARSNFMSSVIERITEAFSPNYGPNVLSQTVANSFFVSSDVIHAVNPNFLNVYLENHAPRLNVGVAVSADSNGHMTTDSVSYGFIKRVADHCGSTLQVFQIRNDSRSGGTIGPMTSSRIGMRAIDVGIPQLSMHSIRATTGSLDPGLGVKLFKGFFDYFEEVDKEFADF
ncbi:glycosyl hydrolase family 71-domain-containing protein [Aspergillus pseudotamarii]|uniref:Glycosyl hydrolase family 71-domain-containing protein n=1 Tax=Aspergillus pseudotamarii TaxID=132259 RepID=A0A5N6SMD2_ASPPS|nr:glycosyl hydrolase family 71-domain-containing protein [Aspergillus pseudotamarii]KAE8134861.1 glycosyl hydrolase family 71-domain-containing protein [Aspergillus pseudotamarii]